MKIMRKVVQSSKPFFALLFSAVTQGILGAAGAVYANNLLKQYSKRKEEDQDADT